MVLKRPSSKRFSWAQCFRIIPSRFPPIWLFERVADPTDQTAIDALEGMTNTRLRHEVGELHLVPQSDWVTGPGAGYVMAAFTHVNPQGSRFSDGTFGCFMPPAKNRQPFRKPSTTEHAFCRRPGRGHWKSICVFWSCAAWASFMMSVCMETKARSIGEIIMPIAKNWPANCGRPGQMALSFVPYEIQTRGFVWPDFGPSPFPNARKTDICVTYGMGKRSAKYTKKKRLRDRKSECVLWHCIATPCHRHPDESRDPAAIRARIAKQKCFYAQPLYWRKLDACALDPVSRFRWSLHGMTMRGGANAASHTHSDFRLLISGFRPQTSTRDNCNYRELICGAE